MGDRRIMLIFTGLPEVFVPADDTHFGTTREIAVTSVLWNINAQSLNGVIYEEFANPPTGWILPTWRLKRAEFLPDGYHVWLKGPAQYYQVQLDKLIELRETLNAFTNFTSSSNYMGVVGDDNENFTPPSPAAEPLPTRLIFNEDEVQAIYPPAPIANANLP